MFFGNEVWPQQKDRSSNEGMPHNSRLHTEVEKSIQSVMAQRRSISIDPKLLSDHFTGNSQALVSHIPEHESDAVNGVLVQVISGQDENASQRPAENGYAINGTSPSNATKSQLESKKSRTKVLIPRWPQQDESDLSESEPDGMGSCAGNTEGGNTSHGEEVTDIPLDKNPFFKRFASMLPTGLAILNHDAEAIFVNPQFHDLTVHEDKDKSFKAWPHTIHPSDYERVMDAYREAFERQEPLRIEFRAQGKGNPWRLLLLSPLKEDTLSQSSLQEYGGFICAIIDITTNKVAEISEREAAREAQERKERQERFIDMISHEIRNPLSAVLHCAENVLEVANNPDSKLGDEARTELVEAAETVQLCVAHQRSIVDEVLSFSKLDASLLTLSPKAVQPKTQFINTLKMFQPEMRKRSINFEFKVDYSYEDFHVGWVNADIVRMAQVLVNLVTNAIKFTAKKNGKREITVAIGASIERPTSYPPNVVFFGTDEKSYKMDGTNTTEWGNGEALHIMVAVIDTGIGISDEMQKKLFQRFHQAMPKTEQSYGGSGLGLNISRKLCHLHGGEVGVSSREGKGSTFGFFFKVRRTEGHGDEDRPSDEETLASAELEYQLHRLDQLPDDVAGMHETKAPEDWCNKAPEHVDEASPNSSKDISWKHTQRLANTAQRKHENHEQDHPDQSNHPSKSESNGTGKLTLLLVEDNFINARILRRKLESKGIAVRTASNGREAVDAATAATPPSSAFDIILMDQEMPVMNGSSASQAIRSWELKMQEQHKIERYHVPILGVSANVRQAQKDAMLSAGMDDVIGKPYDFSELISRIRKLIKGAEGNVDK
jgi:signal transduction histidine kinase/CheY-like chemotaxis protein